MEKLIQILINKAYRYYRDNYYSKIKQQLFVNPKLFRLFDSGIKESLVIFAGFEVSYNLMVVNFPKEMKFEKELV